MYIYGNIDWPQSNGSVSCSAGYSLGDEGNMYVIPGSQIGDSVGIMSTTNINEPGIWLFRVDMYDTCMLD